MYVCMYTQNHTHTHTYVHIIFDTVQVLTDNGMQVCSTKGIVLFEPLEVCVCACVCACARACVRVCVCSLSRSEWSLTSRLLLTCY